MKAPLFLRTGVTGLALALIASTAHADCTMQTQMQSAADTTQQERLNAINTNMQMLGYLSQLQTACMQAFQLVPTQGLPGGLIAATAMNKIATSACSSLVQTARNTAQSALASATASVQQQINNLESSAVSSVSSVNSTLGNATAQTINTSTGGVLGNLSNSISRLFQ